MKSNEVEQLGERLKQIGFSERAVAMIIEQVKDVGIDLSDKAPARTPTNGLAEATAPVFSPAPSTEVAQPEDTKITGGGSLIFAGVIAVLGMLTLSWNALTVPPDVAIMTGSSANSVQGLQALLLAAWVLLPPAIVGLGWRRLPESITARNFIGAFWAGVGIFLATVMLASG